MAKTMHKIEKTNQVKKGKKKKKKSFLRFTMICVCVYVAITLVREQTYLNELRKVEVAKKQEIQAIERENTLLEEKLKNIESPEYIEKQAREQLGLVRPGEKIYVDTNENPENKGK